MIIRIFYLTNKKETAFPIGSSFIKSQEEL